MIVITTTVLKQWALERNTYEVTQGDDWAENLHPELLHRDCFTQTCWCGHKSSQHLLYLRSCKYKLSQAIKGEAETLYINLAWRRCQVTIEARLHYYSTKYSEQAKIYSISSKQNSETKRISLTEIASSTIQIRMKHRSATTLVSQHLG